MIDHNCPGSSEFNSAKILESLIRDSLHHPIRILKPAGPDILKKQDQYQDYLLSKESEYGAFMPGK